MELSVVAKEKVESGAGSAYKQGVQPPWLVDLGFGHQ